MGSNIFSFGNDIKYEETQEFVKSKKDTRIWILSLTASFRRRQLSADVTEGKIS